jgi:hypothetical protein
MKTLIIFLALTFSVMFSSSSYAEWTKVDENVNGSTFYVDFERIRKHDGYVYWWNLSDYSKRLEEGFLSSTSYLKGDCKLFRIKSLAENYFTEQMGGGLPKVWNLTEFQKRWRYVTPNSVNEVKLKEVCNQ